MVPALDVRRLAKTYRAGIAGCCASSRALADVSIQARPGELVGVWGGVGAGKTTLLLCAAGALRPDHGEVRWFGVPAAASTRVACGVGYVAAWPSHYAFLTARQSLEHDAAQTHAGAAAADVAPLLRRAGLDGALLRRRVSELPAGALRGLAVARALLERPRLLLVDAPFDDLEDEWSAAIAHLLRAVAAEGVACVVSARRYDALRPIADRVVTLAGGHAAAHRVVGGTTAARVAESDARRRAAR